ncbi:MAG: cysteine desulfurase family protein [candidate division KSB1 bacterium]|nr:cysteine desulfurase family protein [candidate division KSB1 bacterium]
MSDIYLDNNATTEPLPTVKEAVINTFKVFGNPSSPHAAGIKARKLIEEARAHVADMIKAEPHEIVFTSGGTESIVTSFKSALQRHDKQRRSVIVSSVEHTAVMETAAEYKNHGYSIDYVPVDYKGQISMEALEERLKENPNAFVSIMYANNETGVIFPVEEISNLAKKYNAVLHIDAVQAAGKLPVDIKKIQCDYLSLSAHKFHGLKGTGALYVNRKAHINPFLSGHQESKRRGGTENVPGIVAMGVAAKEVHNNIDKDMQHMKTLRDRLQNKLLNDIKGSVVNGDPQQRICNTLNLQVPYKDAAMLVEALSHKGVYVSTGAACTTGGEPSHVLAAMGLEESEVNRSLRISTSRLTNVSDIEQALEIMIETERNSINVYN